jgi:hypothetical protein
MVAHAMEFVRLFRKFDSRVLGAEAEPHYCQPHAAPFANSMLPILSRQG